MEEFLFDYPIEVMNKGGASESYIPAVMELWKGSAISVRTKCALMVYCLALQTSKVED
jgi:hypothetical protein